MYQPTYLKVSSGVTLTPSDSNNGQIRMSQSHFCSHCVNKNYWLACKRCKETKQGGEGLLKEEGKEDDDFLTDFSRIYKDFWPGFKFERGFTWEW